MMRTLISVSVLLLSTIALEAQAQGRLEAAEAAARGWLAEVDAAEYNRSWKNAATLFKSQVSAQQWRDAIAGTREPMGAVKSRTLSSANYTTSLPGAPDGEYVVLQFATEFENKKVAIETVTPMLDDGTWRVSGYYIK